MAWCLTEKKDTKYQDDQNKPDGMGWDVPHMRDENYIHNLNLQQMNLKRQFRVAGRGLN
jgi:hypothetical protein